MMKRNIDWSKVILIILIVVLSVVTTCVNKRFASVDNLLSIMRQISAPGILAVGMTFVVLTGGIDLSTGYGVTLGAIVLGLVFNKTGNPWLAMLGGVAACVLLGIVNGLLITKAKIIPFITTLATMLVTRGVLNVIASGSKFFLKDDVFTAIASGGVLGGRFPISTLIFLVFFAVAVVLLKWTPFGSYVYAIGSSEKNTQLAGIKTGRYKFFTYVILGVAMGVAAIVMGSRIMQVTQESGGDSYLMDCLMAVIIGGTAIEGGKGDLLGTFLGVIFLGIVSSLLVFLSIPTIAQQCFKGLIIILALLLNYASKQLKARQEIEAKARLFAQSQKA